MAIILTLENQATTDYHNYAKIKFMFDEDVTWYDITSALQKRGLPALGYLGTENIEKIEEALSETY